MWLRAQHGNVTYATMADHVGCCVDTLKRILVRLGLEEFDGAKYQTSTSSQIQTWQRPCMDCGNTKPRPKTWYYCRPCRIQRGHDND